MKELFLALLLFLFILLIARKFTKQTVHVQKRKVSFLAILSGFGVTGW